MKVGDVVIAKESQVGVITGIHVRTRASGVIYWVDTGGGERHAFFEDEVRPATQSESVAREEP